MQGQAVGHRTRLEPARQMDARGQLVFPSAWQLYVPVQNAERPPACQAPLHHSSALHHSCTAGHCSHKHSAFLARQAALHWAASSSRHGSVCTARQDIATWPCRWLNTSLSLCPPPLSAQTACNRVDTLPHNFINQADGCRRAPTQCLRGQLGFLYDQDNAMRDAGKPTYMLSKWTKYAANVKVSLHARALGCWAAQQA